MLKWSDSSPKNLIILSFTHPHAISNVYDFLLLQKTKQDIKDC